MSYGLAAVPTQALHVPTLSKYDWYVIMWLSGTLTDAILQAQAQDKKNPEGTIVADFVADFVARDCPATTQASNDSGLGGLCNHPKPHTGKATARTTSLSTCAPTRSSGTTRGEPPASIKNMHQKLSGTAQGPKWSGWPIRGGTGKTGDWESSTTPAMFFPIVVGAFGEINENASKLITKHETSAPHCQD
ncbi:hypothetical protein THAOC_16498 [Thalassiosira oceanica]|uniref:Uncharacterized protein n=1 Tax=Thalassiosira oceanica TaxID=159749 RepID=K0S9P5_THAOC|nr:hypothetical protein THAOC_16498 [Thalassiosira oceanica]|eukprot:EJK62873.1 hypothetical protein THAOC_16498 [Thalassiosira oceanica]